MLTLGRIICPYQRNLCGKTWAMSMVPLPPWYKPSLPTCLLIALIRRLFSTVFVRNLGGKTWAWDPILPARQNGDFGLNFTYFLLIFHWFSADGTYPLFFRPHVYRFCLFSAHVLPNLPLIFRRSCLAGARFRYFPDHMFMDCADSPPIFICHRFSAFCSADIVLILSCRDIAWECQLY